MKDGLGILCSVTVYYNIDQPYIVSDPNSDNTRDRDCPPAREHVRRDPIHS